MKILSVHDLLINIYEKIKDKADLIISQGNTRTLISASKQDKNIIAIPRLLKNQEHVDDHQLQVIKVSTDVKVSTDAGYIRAIYDMNNLGKIINEELWTHKPYQGESNILETIELLIEKEL